MAQSVGHQALGHKVMISNLLLAVPEVTLGGYFSGSLTIPRFKIGTQALGWEFRVDSEYHYAQVRAECPQ